MEGSPADLSNEVVSITATVSGMNLDEIQDKDAFESRMASSLAEGLHQADIISGGSGGPCTNCVEVGVPIAW